MNLVTARLSWFSYMRTTGFYVLTSKLNIFAVVDESNMKFDRTKGFKCTSIDKTVQSAHEFVNENAMYC